jgi:hypothetical protein
MGVPLFHRISETHGRRLQGPVAQQGTIRVAWSISKPASVEMLTAKPCLRKPVSLARPELVRRSHASPDSSNVKRVERRLQSNLRHITHLFQHEQRCRCSRHCHCCDESARGKERVVLEQLDVAKPSPRVLSSWIGQGSSKYGSDDDGDVPDDGIQTVIESSVSRCNELRRRLRVTSRVDLRVYPVFGFGWRDLSQSRSNDRGVSTQGSSCNPSRIKIKKPDCKLYMAHPGT